MISEGGEINLSLDSSKSNSAKSELSTFSRMETMRKLAGKFNLPVNQSLLNDEHYWYLVTRDYWGHRKTTIETAEILEKKVERSADQLGRLRRLAIENALKTAEEKYHLQKEAATDGLTGAFNRRALDNWLLNLLGHRRRGMLDTIILFDVDRFKSFNDQYGHSVGDAVLKELVKLIKEQIRGIDIVARYGGEEFVIVMPSSIGGEDNGVKERLLKRVNEIREKIATELKDRVNKASGAKIEQEITASFGVMFIDNSVIVKTPNELHEKIYQVVDRYLYQAKKAGRNTIFDEEGRYPRE